MCSPPASNARTRSPDTPHCGRVAAGRGFYICAGFSGHGFKLGQAVGVMASDLLTEEGDPRFDLAMFRLNRYEDESAVRASYEYSIVG